MEQPNRKLGFENLDAWKLSMELTNRVMALTRTAPFRGQFDLQSQLNRCSLSIPSNIAEGEERGSNRDALRHLYIARGSAAELRTQLMAARDAGLITREICAELDGLCIRVTQLIYGVIRHRRKLIRREKGLGDEDAC